MLSPGRMEALDRALDAAARTDPGARDGDLPRAGRRARGAYFTPLPLCEFVVAEVLGAWLARTRPRWRADGSPELTALDPAAGDGRFLVAAVDYLVARATERGADPAAARSAIVRRCVVGIERDPEFAAAARSALGAGAVIHVREALLDPPGLPPIDAVVGNPPYQRSIHLARVDAPLWHGLRGRYAATSHGEWDLYAAFLEQALDWVRPGGEVGLVVPSRWLTAGFATRLRGKLASASAVRAIVDFGAAQIFPGATTYASVALLSRSPSPEVAVARRSARGWHCGAVGAATLDEQPWRLAVGPERALLDRLSAAAPTLGEVARIVKGAGTNADPVYLFTEVEPSPRGELVEVRSRALDGETVVLERGLLRPCLRGRDVRGYGEVDPGVQCLVPYRRDGRLVSPDQLEARWPRTAAYLGRCRELLDRRERGRFRGAEFYRFGRPQNLAFFGDPVAKLVVPDVAREGRALLDSGGALCLDSAYAVRLRDPDHGYSLALLLAVLNSPLVERWLVANGIPLRGGYLRLKTAYLRSLPLPPRSSRIAEVERAVAVRPVDGARVSELVRRAYRVEPAEWQH